MKEEDEGNDWYVNKLFNKKISYFLDTNKTKDNNSKTDCIKLSNIGFFNKLKGELLEIQWLTKEELEKLKKDLKTKNVEVKYYLLYLYRISELIKDKYENRKITDNKTDEDYNNKDRLYVLEYLNYMKSTFIDKDFNQRKFFGLYVASIEKINNEYAYRDYILNYLLSIFENIRFLRKATLWEILKNIKINDQDLEYPAFLDLILYWLPLMLIYFSNIDTDE